MYTPPMSNLMATQAVVSETKYAGVDYLRIMR
jgi:hypothetical protein